MKSVTFKGAPVIWDNERPEAVLGYLSDGTPVLMLKEPLVLQRKDGGLVTVFR